MDKALESIKTILDNTRNPRLAEEEDHTYDDKYALAELMTNTFVASEINIFEELGFTDDIFQRIVHGVHDEKRPVTLRFQATDYCDFEQEKDVKVATHESEVEITTDQSTGSWFDNGEKTEKQRSKVSTALREFHWRVGLDVKLLVFFGTDVDGAIELQSRTGSANIVTSGGLNVMGSAEDRKSPPPIAEKTVHQPIDINLTWLMEMIAADKASRFSIDRFSEEGIKSCKTPRRNNDVDKAVDFSMRIKSWAVDVVSFFKTRVERDILRKHHPAQSNNAKNKMYLADQAYSIAQDLFYPVLPLMENSSMLPESDIEAFLEEQRHRMKQAVGEFSEQLSSAGDGVGLLTRSEATLILLTQHIVHSSHRYIQSVKYVEHMLESQLKQAIGKEVTAKDFSDFMSFHNQKIFGSQYAPNLFSYAVRRPDHYPDGMLSIEAMGGTGKPVETLVRQTSNSSVPMFIPISAATSVEIKGDRYLHGWMQYYWSQGGTHSYQITARAHQFSSFLVIVGKMAGPNSFKPESAIILQNKDEVLIPLLTEVLPSAKEFKDAIASLSPEQRAFAESFRAMQLESSVFGVCVIRLKEQLEKLLNLPDGALTKEIQLTQDLMSLFIDFQIPSDLLSFEGAPDTTLTQKVVSVKSNVKAVMEVIDKAKEAQLKEEKQKAEMRESRYGPSAGPTASPSAAFSATLSAADRSAQESFSAENNLRSQKRKLGESYRPPDVSESASTSADTSSSSEESKMKAKRRRESPSPVMSEKGEDFTLIPKLLDSKIETYDSDGSLRSTIIKTSNLWSKTWQQNLLSPSETTNLYGTDIGKEKKKAFDLLDALSRSGSLAIDASELHIIIAVSHCFEKNIMSTVIEDNINPIEKVEKSALLLASTIYGEHVSGLIDDGGTKDRLSASFPQIFEVSA